VGWLREQLLIPRVDKITVSVDASRFWSIAAGSFEEITEDRPL
jgi:hypothetical protein